MKKVIAGFAAFALVGSALAVTWPATPTGEVTGGKIGSLITADTVNSRVGIGTASPTTKLDVRSTGNGLAGGITVTSSDYDTSGSYVTMNKNTDNIAFIQSTQTSGDDDLSLQPNGGKVGIGTLSPGSTLEVDGGITPDKVTADPCGGADYSEGSLFYNDTSNYYCYCDGTNDVQMHSPATACF